MSNVIAHLIKLDLSDRTVYLSDGGFVPWDGDIYLNRDSVIGSIGAVQAFEAGFGGNISQIDVEFNNPGAGAVAALSEAALANRRIEIFVADYDLALGAVSGTPERKFLGQVDQATSTFAEGVKSVGVSCTSLAEPIFSQNTSNAMSHQFQQLISPGDTGHAQGTGLEKQWAWGTASIGGASGGSGGGMGSGGGNVNERFFEAFQ
jgi:hypothetical protein